MGIKQADDALTSIIELADKIDGIDKSDYMDALESAKPRATREARKYLVQNYRASGVETQSGELLRAIKKAELTIDNAKKGGTFVRVGMQPGKDKEFYVAANSVNYGRVTGRGIKGGGNGGARKRRKLKDSIAKGGKGSKLKSAGAGLSYDAETVGSTKAGSATVSTTLGSATVTKAFDFYKLKKSQGARVRDILLRGAQAHLEEKLSK